MLFTKKELETAYDEGWDAFIAGQDYYLNPYPLKYVELHEKWKSGWLGCEKAWTDPKTEMIDNKPVKAFIMSF